MMNKKSKSILLILIFFITLLAEKTDDKPTCDGPDDTGILVFELQQEPNNAYDPDIYCGNATTCNLSPIECMAGDYKINLDAIFGGKEDYKKWYVEIKASGSCDDGSNYTQKFEAGKNLSAQLNFNGDALEFYPTNSSELYTNRDDIDFKLIIREPCRSHTEDCKSCFDTQHRYLNFSHGSTFSRNVRANQRKYFIPSVDSDLQGTQCGCSL